MAVSILKRNIIANFGGSAWAALMGLVFIPLYIHFLGIEAYGLIGVFATLLGFFALLDMGLSSTLSREMARLSAHAGTAREMRDLVRTLEIPYWIVGIGISLSVVALSPVIAHHWVNAEKVPEETVRTAVMIMGLSVAFQWPLSFYSGGLAGLQKQVLLNGINVVMATFRGFGAVLILWLVSPTIEAYFIWQIFVGALHIAAMVYLLWRNLPADLERPKFSLLLLKSVWRFAAGMMGITVLVTILVQLDKVILSRMLSLEMFGYYMFASVVAMNLRRLVTPIYSAAYPRLTGLVAKGAIEDVAALYHKSSQAVSVLVLPASVVLAIFSEEIILLWTRSPETAGQAHLLVTILVFGTALNCLLNMPYALQLAYGWTKFAFYSNLVSVLFLAPAMVFFVKYYGAVGAAIAWVILNLGYVFVSLPIMHARLLAAEKWRWYFEDVGIPLATSVVIVLTLRMLLPTPAGSLALGAKICGIAALALAAAVMATPVTREWVLVRLKYGGANAD